MDPEPQPASPSQPAPQMHFPDGYVPPAPSPADSPPPAAQPNPVGLNSQIGVSGSSLGETGGPKNKRRWVKWLSILAGLTAVVLAGLFVFGLYLQSLQTTTYQNQAGERFKLKFYPFSETKNFTDLNSYGRGSGADEASSSLVLVSPDLRADGMKIAMTISKNSIDPKLNVREKPTVCTENAFTVHITALNYDAPVCAISVDHKPIMYMFQINTPKHFYFGTVFYEYPKPNSPEDAQNIVNSIDLRSSNAAIKEIIASIEPQE
jgi:hypothetical protein